MIKLTAFFDTVFFTLSKKWTHVSFLDVCHHLTISLGAYVYVLYAPGSKTLWHLFECSTIDCLMLSLWFGVVFSGGQAIILAYVNCFVNAVMYTYYLISIFRPSVMLKKNMTRLQIVSFAFCNECFFYFFGLHPNLISFIFPPNFIDSILNFIRTFFTWTRASYLWLSISKNYVHFWLCTKLIHVGHIYKVFSSNIWTKKRTRENSMNQSAFLLNIFCDTRWTRVLKQFRK